MDGAEPTSSLGDANRRREPVWRVVGVSIAAGLLSALVLTLGVFGGSIALGAIGGL